jgi:hypothetical protein
VTKTRRLLICMAIVLVLPIARVAQAAEFSLWPYAEVDEAYDDNVKETSSNKKGDFLTVESFGATLEAETAARSFFLTYTTLMIEHVSYPGEDSFGQDHYVGLQDTERLSANTTLSITNSFLVGNSVSGSFVTSGATPIGSQLLSSILYKTGTLSNTFAANLFSKFSDSFTWSANVHQNYFSTLSNTPSAGGITGSAASTQNFNQGAMLTGDWNLGERFTGGGTCDFEDYRFSNSDIPTTEAEWLQGRLGWGSGTPYSVLAQVGPIISESSSGTIGTSHVAAQTKVDFGYLITASYTDRRFKFSATAGQVPELSAGLGGYSTAQTYAALIQYKLSRRATLFANFGYVNFTGTGISTEVLTYTGGVSYRLAQMFTLTAQYLGYQTIGGGTSTSTVFAIPVGTTVTNIFMIGVIVTPLPLKWSM